jgi:hypothetical protein
MLFCCSIAALALGFAFSACSARFGGLPCYFINAIINTLKSTIMDSEKRKFWGKLAQIVLQSIISALGALGIISCSTVTM